MNIKNGIAMEPDFLLALQALSSKEMTVEECIELVSATKDVEQRIASLQEARKALILKRCCKEKNGNIIFDKNTGDTTFPTPADKRLCEEDLRKLADIDLEIKLSKKIALSKKDRLTPRKYFLLQDIIQVVD